MKNKPSDAFVKAKASVDRIKRFYKHLIIYVVINIIVLIFKVVIFRFFINEGVTDQGFYNWLQLNMLLTPILWGIGLFFHGLLVFRYPDLSLKFMIPKVFKKWEERQIQKYLKEDDKH